MLQYESRKYEVGKAPGTKEVWNWYQQQVVKPSTYEFCQEELEKIIKPRIASGKRVFTDRPADFELGCYSEYATHMVLYRDFGIVTKVTGHDRGARYDLTLLSGLEGGYQVRSSKYPFANIFVKPVGYHSGDRRSDSNKDLLSDIFIQCVPVTADRLTWWVSGWLYGLEIYNISNVLYKPDRVSCAIQKSLKPLKDLPW